jgi:thymidylate synthase (FAD)
MKSRIEVDDGFIELVDSMGNGDLAVVNAARVSFNNQAVTLDEKDVKLIKYLAKHKHMSPFRHVQFSFRIKTSETVMRQFYKHQVGCGYTSSDQRFESTVWNEVSGRYAEYEEFHKPSKFRKQHTSNKQASLPDVLVDQNDEAIKIYNDAIEYAQSKYKELLNLGVCREQARMLLPVSFMTTVCWTTSLEAAVNFIKLRDHEGAQLEIRKLATAIRDLIEPICPHSVKALLDE